MGAKLIAFFYNKNVVGMVPPCNASYSVGFRIMINIPEEVVDGKVLGRTWYGPSWPIAQRVQSKHTELLRNEMNKNLTWANAKLDNYVSSLEQ